MFPPHNNYRNHQFSSPSSPSASSFNRSNDQSSISSSTMTNAPLWQWLLNPKLRAQLHETRKIPGPQEHHNSNNNHSSSSSSNPNSNSFISHEASLWKWRMRMQSIMAQGQPILPNNNNNNQQQPQQGNKSFQYSTASNSHTLQQQKDYSSVSHISAKKKSDFRFGAKTLVSNLINEIQSRTLKLVMINLSPIGRNSVGASKFDTLPEARLASLEVLQRSATGNSQTRLSEEFFHWKHCLDSMMLMSKSTESDINGIHTNESNNNNNNNNNKNRTKVVVVSQSNFIMIGARIGQLVTLGDNEEAQESVEQSLKDLNKILERDWASLIAQRGQRLMQETLDEHHQRGLGFSSWFNLVLLPIAVVLAPPHASMNDDLMIDNAVEFCSCLRKILFPTIDNSNNNRSNAAENATTVDYKTPNRNSSSSVQMKRNAASAMSSSSRHRNGSAAATSSPSVSPAVVGGGDSVIYHSNSFEQRILGNGFYEPPAAVSSSPSSRQRNQLNNNSYHHNNKPTSSPTVNNSTQQHQRPRPATSPQQYQCQQQQATTTKPIAHKIPRAIQELVQRQQQQQYQNQQTSTINNNNTADQNNVALMFPSSEELMSGRVHQTADGRKSSPNRDPDFHQPFPRNVLREGPSSPNNNDSVSNNNHNHSTSSGAPLHLVVMNFSLTKRRTTDEEDSRNWRRSPQNSPTLPKGEYQLQKEAQMKKLREISSSMMQNNNNTMMNNESPSASLGHMPVAKVSSSALGVSVVSSPVKRFSIVAGSAGVGDNNSPNASATRSSSPNKGRGMIHSKKIGRRDSILKVTSSRSQDEKRNQEIALMRKVSMSSTARSLKNRAPRELHSTRLEGIQHHEFSNGK